MGLLCEPRVRLFHSLLAYHALAFEWYDVLSCDEVREIQTIVETPVSPVNSFTMIGICFYDAKQAGTLVLQIF